MRMSIDFFNGNSKQDRTVMYHHCETIFFRCYQPYYELQLQLKAAQNTDCSRGKRGLREESWELSRSFLLHHRWKFIHPSNSVQGKRLDGYWYWMFCIVLPCFAMFYHKKRGIQTSKTVQGIYKVVPPQQFFTGLPPWLAGSMYLA